jgi:hypothetical protein
MKTNTSALKEKSNAERKHELTWTIRSTVPGYFYGAIIREFLPALV